MTTLLLFSLLCLLSFVSAFITSLIKLILRLKLLTHKMHGEDGVRGQGPYSLAPCGARSKVSQPCISDLFCCLVAKSCLTLL